MKRRFLILGMPGLMAFNWLERLFAPNSELLDERWKLHAASSAIGVDHTAWTRFLMTYLIADDSGIGRVKYGSVTKEDLAGLKTYVDKLSKIQPMELDRDDQLAFWINLYNAKTVEIVLDHYPVKSIRDITFGKRRASGPWDKPVINVDGIPLSLNDIEHGIIRPVFAEPRIHYAVNCAAAGCPNLQAQAFTGKNLEDMLNAAAAAYVNHSRGVSIVDGKLVLSSIYNWFAEDFGGNEHAILAHIGRFAEPALKARLGAFMSIDDYDYDWSLNRADG